MDDLTPRPGDLALTVRQPWADLIMAGVKDVENRGWPPPSTLPQWFLCSQLDPPVRRSPEMVDRSSVQDCDTSDGPFPFRLWIHAGKAWDDHWRLTTRGAAEHPALGIHRTYIGGRFAAGLILGSVLVTGCHHAEDVACACSRWAQLDAYHWTLADPQPLATPIPMRGRQKLWRIPEAANADA